LDTFFLYILRCADGSYYVGSTSDPVARLEAHNAGRGPRYTACRRPVELVHSEPFETMESARHREAQLKKWSRAKKEALIAGDRERLHELSRRRSPSGMARRQPVRRCLRDRPQDPVRPRLRQPPLLV